MFFLLGGLAYIVDYLVNWEIVKALMYAVIFGMAVIGYVYLSGKFRDERRG